MYSILRWCFLVVFGGTVLGGVESRVPLLYEYRSPVEILPSSPDVVHLDDFIVIGKRDHLSYTIERDLERFFNRRDFVDFGRKRRVELVTDGSEFANFTLRDSHLSSIRGPVNSGLDLKLRDTFLIDLPGGGVLKAQFRSGLSIQLDKKTRLILRPSRNKLVSVRVDW
jgi:hypothetical protein